MSDGGGFFLFIFLFVLLLFIGFLPIAGKWKVYGKLGMPGWYSIVPVYAVIVLICSWAFCWVDTLGWMLALAQLVMNIIVLNDMSHAFGKETGYTIGLAIAGFVFWTLLGFGSSEPVGLDSDADDEF